MALITKAELARRLNLSKSRVTQLVKAGMPVEVDGRVDETAARAWVDSNVERSPLRAERFEKQSLRQAPSKQADLAASDREGVIGFMQKVAYGVPSLTATFAAQAGAPMATVYTLHCMMQLAAMEIADSVIGPLLGEAGELKIWQMDQFQAPEWAQLAAKVGERVDFEAWKAHLRRVDAELSQ